MRSIRWAISVVALTLSASIDAAPSVTLVAPATHARYIAPAAIDLVANPTVDPGRSVERVEFLADGEIIGVATQAPYTFNWTSVAPGNYALRARVFDSAGRRDASPVVRVRVRDNKAPHVRILTPDNRETFPAPASIAVSLFANDRDDNLTNVELFANGTPLTTFTAAPFEFNWTNVAPGTYAVTALATDDLGLTTTSRTKTITVTSAPPPPADPKIYFIHVDHLNTPRLIADEMQRTVWRWDQLEPFGDSAPDENPSGLGAFEFPGRLPGQYFDKETNLHYNYFRDFDPVLGRYAESDPIGLKAGPNLYAYVGGSPLRFNDRFGLDRWGDQHTDPWYPESGRQPPFALRPDGNEWGWGCGTASTDHIVPDAMYGFNVTPACRRHDMCYSLGCLQGNTKQRCDDKFYSDIVDNCLAAGRTSVICKMIAWSYYQGVHRGGDDAYRIASAACSCQL